VTSLDPLIRHRGQTMETVMRMPSLTRFLRRRRTYWTALKELSNMSDHELRDIGIDRADIHAIARQMSEEQS
jgi:uncharacterized protein YjiS (DUF1127 family)